MLDIGKLAEHLVGSGIIRAEQFEEAKRCVSARRLSLDKALVLLKFVDYAQLGKCYSDICRLPYVPLLSGRPTEEARRLLSAECVVEWGFFHGPMILTRTCLLLLCMIRSRSKSWSG